MDTIKININALKKDNWSEQELDKAKLVVDFVQNIMNNHNFDYILKNQGNAPYIQHNRTIPDGIDGVVGTVKQFAKRFPEYAYDVKHIFVDGNYVILHSHATVNKKNRGNDAKGLNIIDSWRVEDGKLVEHWDAVQPIDGFMRFYAFLTGGAVRNSNEVF